jgi:hypothetical protein
MGVIRLDFDKEVLRAQVRAFLSAFAFVIAVAIATALVCGLTGCAADGELAVDENPPAPLQTMTYDMELEELPWKATKVYDATSGRSWWLLRRENTSSYVVLGGASNVPVG